MERKPYAKREFRILVLVEKVMLKDQQKEGYFN
jgi:hypothetical protein